MKNKYLFGPVPSRRLGVSLGIDLVPYKVCSLDCVYCECGETTLLSVDRREFVPVEEVISELQNYLQTGPDLDCVTFSGSGEPTLYSRIDSVIDFIKDNFPHYRVVVLTNGTLLTQNRVRTQLKRADLVIPSLDAVSEEVFEKLNRPHGSLVCREVISGMKEFRREYKGELWLEIMIIPGLNDTEAELKLLREALRELKPDRVQLGTLDRPGAVSWVRAAEQKDLEAIAAFLGDAEIIQNYAARKAIPAMGPDREREITGILKRRPCTAEDLAQILQLRLVEVHKYLRLLGEKKEIVGEKQERGQFYKLKGGV